MTPARGYPQRTAPQTPGSHPLHASASLLCSIGRERSSQSPVWMLLLLDKCPHPSAGWGEAVWPLQPRFCSCAQASATLNSLWLLEPTSFLQQGPAQVSPRITSSENPHHPSPGSSPVFFCNLSGVTVTSLLFSPSGFTDGRGHRPCRPDMGRYLAPSKYTVAGQASGGVGETMSLSF